MIKNEEQLQLNSRTGAITFTAMIVLYLFITLVGQLIVGAFAPFGTVTYTAICASLSSIAMLLVCVYFIGVRKQPFKEVTGVKKFNALYLFPAILMIGGMFSAFGFVNGQIANVFAGWGLNVSTITLPMDNAWHFVLYTFVLAILPAIVEEIFFRGLLLKCLSGIKPFSRVLLISTCFALYHGNATQQLYQMIYGALLTLLAMRCGSAIPGMIVHFFNNFIVIAIEYFSINVNLINPMLIVSGFLMLGGAISLIFWVLRPKEKPQVIGGEALRFWVPYGLIGAFICHLTIILNLISNRI
jgi:membrane protease YdiL (CAAX protease family)